jgi:hypothetical protein
MPLGGSIRPFRPRRALGSVPKHARAGGRPDRESEPPGRLAWPLLAGTSCPAAERQVAGVAGEPATTAADRVSSLAATRRREMTRWLSSPEEEGAHPLQIVNNTNQTGLARILARRSPLAARRSPLAARASAPRASVRSP